MVGYVVPHPEPPPHIPKIPVVYVTDLDLRIRSRPAR